MSRLAGLHGRVRDLTVLALSAIAVTACIVRDELVCEDDSQCSRSADGECHEGGCAYPDGDCPSGLRYGDFAGERSGRCVDDGVADDTSSTGAEPTSDGGGSETLDETSSGSPGSSSGTDDDTGSIPSVCDDIECSGAGACVVVADAPSCACESGYYMVGLECVLDPCDDVVCHYVDSSLGDDANNGSEDAPWRTIGRVALAFADALPGEHFLFRRGGVWGDEDGYRLYVTGAIGSSDAPIVIGAYGPLADGRPRLAGNIRILASSHVVLRDLDIQDDPAVMEGGSRPCVIVQDSDHVVVYDTIMSSCITHGIWVAYGSSYTSIVDNLVHDAGKGGIAVADYDDGMTPVIRVGHHHWVIDNVVERTDEHGILVAIESTELSLGDAKVVGNRVAGSGTDGIRSTTTGYTWVVDNVTARAAAPNVWQASLVIGAQAGGQLSGNIAFETAGHGILANRIARIEANTVIGDSTTGDAFFVDDLGEVSASRNLLWSRAGGDTVRVVVGAANEHIVTLENSWYGGMEESACVFRDTVGEYDLAGWREATGFDLMSSCGPIPGLGAYELGVPVDEWDAAFWAELTPDASWVDCREPAGALDCDGAPIGPTIEPFDELDDFDGFGWPGPLIVRQRYDVAP